MNQDLLYYITNHAGSLSVQEIIVNFLAALGVGFIIFLSYRFSHSSAIYSARFNVSLWMLTVVTTMVMCVIGNNIALSLGMVGALSIVRFRTAVKDARDTAYIFWCVAAGVCCGISDFMIAVLGSTIIFILMLIIGNVKPNNRFLLVIHCKTSAGSQIEQRLDDIFSGKARLCAKNATRESIEFIFELSDQLMKKKNSKTLTEQLFDISDVYDVNLVAQNDEITA
ncbi:DUF4956 domain-containing protein [Eisenbergiella porci]|uniref:DUF4956 domain-containing protein n=1 Tax=Eisenbergiella porci TaxID=2652274 RepID=UPI002A82E74C|nr:DUF4956 domain-containing protein [Eisenbergiella porci]